MSQLSLLDGGPGWYSVRAQHRTKAGSYFGFCRYFDSENNVYVQLAENGRDDKDWKWTVRMLDEPPRFARDLETAWVRAKSGQEIYGCSGGIPRYCSSDLAVSSKDKGETHE